MEAFIMELMTSAHISVIQTFIFAIVKAISIHSMIHTFMRYRNKTPSVLFICILFIVNCLSTFYEVINITYIACINLIMSLMYYKTNIKDKSNINMILVIVSSSLSTLISYSLHMTNFIGSILFKKSFLTSPVLPFYDSYHYLYFFDWFFSILFILLFIVVRRNKKLNSVYLGYGFIVFYLFLYILSSICLFAYLLEEPAIIYCIIVLFILYNIILYFKNSYESKLDYEKIKNELDKNQRLYKLYQDENKKFSKLKHDIVDKLKEIKVDEIENYFTIVDELITPVIMRCSSNQLLDPILVEIHLLLKELNIENSISMNEDFSFLSEEELILLFSRPSKRILLSGHTTYFQLNTEKDDDGYKIIYKYTTTVPLSEELLSKSHYDKLNEKYSIFTMMSKSANQSVYCIYIKTNGGNNL